MTKTVGPDNSGTLFDHIKEKKRILRDCALAVYLGIPRSTISEIRHGKREINGLILVRICDITGMSLKSARAKIAETNG